MVDIGPKQSLAIDYIAALKLYNWIDKHTRAVFVDIMLYNANTNLFSAAKVVFELPPIGGVHLTSRVESSNLFMYVTQWDYLVLLLQVLVYKIHIIT